jgi:alpha-L-fucosidase 2
LLIPNPGYLISGPSNGSEHGGLVEGAYMDDQIIRDLVCGVVAAGQDLKIDTELSRLSWPMRIASSRICKYGQLREWVEDLDDKSIKQLHVSQIWAEYPGKEINRELTQELLKAACKSMIYRGDATG